MSWSLLRGSLHETQNGIYTKRNSTHHKTNSVYITFHCGQNEMNFVSELVQDKRPIKYKSIIYVYVCADLSFRIFHFGYCLHDILSPELKFHFCQNDRNEITPTMSFKRTCALNAISNEFLVINFASGKFCSHENLMPVWNFISVKMTDMKSIPFWVSFRLNSCEHNKELTEHRSEIFNRNEISYRFEFISPLMWTYSKLWSYILILVIYDFLQLRHPQIDLL